MLLLDNIAFELQKAGGVSLVWQAVINACMQEEALKFTLIDSGLGRDNIFYPKVEDKIPIVSENGPLLFRRYSNVNKNISAKVFHSSYFRTHNGKKVKNIVTVHDFIYEKYDKGVRKFIHLMQKKAALKAADVIICVSENTRKDLLEYHPWLINKDIRVIYNGVGKEFYPLSLGKDFCLASDNKFLLYVGGRQKHKNFKGALKLLSGQYASELQLNFKVVGGGEFTDEEVSLMKDLNIKDRVMHMGHVSNIELNKLYNNAYAFIYPSYYEGFGIPPLEAMSASCPVICSNLSSIPEIVGDAGLMFNPDTPLEAEKYLKRLSEKKFRAEMIEKGINRASGFSWVKTGLETVNLYKEMLRC